MASSTGEFSIGHNRHQRVLCGHCKQWLKAKAFRTHRRLYYDEDSEQWLKKLCEDDSGKRKFAIDA